MALDRADRLDPPRRTWSAACGAPASGLRDAAVALGTVFAGMMFTDTLCPEHRSWVNVLASVAFLGVALSVVGLLRRWTLAPLLTAGVCALGMGIGLIDAIHAPQRGMVLTVIFGALTLGCLLASAWVVRLWSWDRTVAASLGTQRPAAGAHHPAPGEATTATVDSAPSSSPVDV